MQWNQGLRKSADAHILLPERASILQDPLILKEKPSPKDPGFCKKVQIFEFGSKSPLDPKFGPRGPNLPKTDCWGPGESIDTHIVGFQEKIEKVTFLHQNVTLFAFI